MEKLLPIIFFAVLFPSPLKAQEQQTILAIIKYQTIEELNTLFSQDAQVLYYTNDAENSLALALLSTSNEKYLRNLGFTPEIIERDSDINNYVLLYTRVESQANSLAQYGQVYTLTPSLILLKLTDKTQAQEILNTNFQLIPFLARISPPLYQAKTITAQPQPTITTPTALITTRQLLLLAVLVTLLVILLAAIIKYKKSKYV